MHEMSLEPVRPDDSECCGSGCNPCIFDVYEEQLKKWKMKQDCGHVSVALSESKFLPFLIKNIETLTPYIKLFEFGPVKLIHADEKKTLLTNAKCGVDYEILEDDLGLRAGHYLILRGEYEECDEDASTTTHNISRSYTPVLSERTKQSFKIIVALYPDGKMSQFLNKLNVNDIVFWRGPYKDFVYKVNSYKKILLVGGGTGVVPLYNIAREIAENDFEETLIKFVASFKNVDCIILRKELNNLLDYWNFQLNIYISNQGNSEFTLKYNEKVTFSKLDEESMCKELCYYTENECYIVICGPKSFNNFVCNFALEHGVVKENIYVFK